jgi:hypothetical protein
MTLKTIITAVGSAILIIGFVYFSKTDRALLTGTDSKTPKNPALAACDEAIVQELGSPIETSALTSSVRKLDNLTLVTRGFTYADGKGSAFCRLQEGMVELMLELE